MSHPCQAVRCTAASPLDRPFCAGHWWRLPLWLRGAITQHRDRPAGLAYVEAVRDGRLYLARLDGAEPQFLAEERLALAALANLVRAVVWI